MPGSNNAALPCGEITTAPVLTQVDLESMSKSAVIAQYLSLQSHLALRRATVEGQKAFLVPYQAQ